MTWWGALTRLWALPCSLVGSLLALAVVALGGRARWRHGALEVTYRERLADCGARASKLPFRGIVFGHVILAVTAEELRHIGAHERVHVRQYERWGLLFFAAYPLCSLWLWVQGRRPYLDNPFEVEARMKGDGPRGGHASA